jgi:hypothetical protein
MKLGDQERRLGMNFVVGMFWRVLGTVPIQILIGFGSRRTKMTHKKENCEASPVLESTSWKPEILKFDLKNVRDKPASGSGGYRTKKPGSSFGSGFNGHGSTSIVLGTSTVEDTSLFSN